MQSPYLDTLEDADDLDSADSEASLERSGRSLDIGRFWHVLHYLLTGEDKMDDTEVPPPLGNVVLGGAKTKWEATYGMVRYLTPEEVKSVASALEGIREEDLRRRDPATLDAKLYSHHGAWSVETLEMVVDVFTQVRDFFSEAALGGDVVLLSSD